MEFEEDLKKLEVEQQAKANAIMELSKKPVDMVKASVSSQIAHKVKNDESTIERIDKMADKLVGSGLETVENEAETAKNESNLGKLQSYFNEHKEELRTAGIDKPTYLEDMERGVKCHRKWGKVHWALFGWWMTGIRTMFMKAKPFKLWLNIMAILFCTTATGLSIWGIVELIKLIAH